MERVAQAARSAGLIVILDAKRGDIGVSAEHYASFAFEAMGATVVSSLSMAMDRLTSF